MKPIAYTWKILLGLSLLYTSLSADQASATAKVEEYGGQVLKIAQNNDGLRVLIPPKTFEGRVLTDDDLAVLKELGAVQELDLKDTGITDAGLKHLAPLTQLKRLHLEKTKITDAGLASISGLTELEYLNLYGTAITDAGLDHLKGLGKLRNLYLWQTKVKFETAKAFRETATQAGNEQLEINLGWEQEILSKARLASLRAQRERSEGDQPEDQSAADPDNPDFVTQILPIFRENCISCHGEEKQKAGLRLDTFELAMKGNDDGAVIVAEDLIDSKLYQRITLPADDEDLMPPKDGPLSRENIALIKNWIANGAPKEVKKETAKEVAEESKDETEASSVYVEYVAPIFKAKCISCHGEEKQKSGLRLDSLAAIRKGATDGKVITAGKPEESALFQRITLPAGDDDIMPPKGDPLTKAQTDLIKLWITSGAN